ncbi:aspartate/glutamate racemase family protein [Lysinibacillus sp. 54212]|uniref:aspartate/glutamate racemase family protein n=1 Tax=Lysinibacillus sp. 54212 TaxID=3119829 RepID=UPI002FC8B52A
MKTIGLIGGMSWESTAVYYRLINEEVNAILGGLHSAKIILSSVDFAEVEQYQSLGDWEKAGQALAIEAQKLQQAGADFIVICTNTMHKVAPIIQSAISIPLLHIADATAEKIKEKKIKTIGLLGTKYTMEQDFYKENIIQHGIHVIVPQIKERTEINRIIYEELCLGAINGPSKEYYVRAIQHLIEAGAEGIILGCTEIGLLVKEGDVSVPLFDTTRIHAKAAVVEALG